MKRRMKILRKRFKDEISYLEKGHAWARKLCFKQDKPVIRIRLKRVSPTARAEGLRNITSQLECLDSIILIITVLGAEAICGYI